MKGETEPMQRLRVGECEYDIGIAEPHVTTTLMYTILNVFTLPPPPPVGLGGGRAHQFGNAPNASAVGPARRNGMFIPKEYLFYM